MSVEMTLEAMLKILLANEDDSLTITAQPEQNTRALKLTYRDQVYLGYNLESGLYSLIAGAVKS